MLFRLYKLTDQENKRCYFTALPDIDEIFWERRGKSIEWLSDPMPIGKIFSYSKNITENVFNKSKFLSKIKKWLGSTELKNTSIQTVQRHVPAVALPSKDDTDAVQEVLTGRLLLPSELQRALNENKINLTTDLLSVVQLLYLEGKLEVFPAVINSEGTFRCVRCGETKHIIKASCASCRDNECVYCDTCVGMGQARSCQFLLGIKGKVENAQQDILLKLNFPLTKPQEAAFNAARDFVDTKVKYGLVWAACGAGKTEVSFGAIKAELQRGGRILYAIPRKDTVVELEPRIKEAFPDIRVITLHGNSKEKFQQAELVLATTHQTMRFYRNFSLVVLDEADAFPYEGSEMLYLAIERARTAEGKILYMSATPTEKMLAWAKSPDAAIITIPARHHGYPLPEPIFYIEKKAKYPANSDDIKLPHNISELIYQSIEEDKAQVFVFVPTVTLTEPVARALKNILHENIVVSFSHAKDKERDLKRAQFSKREIDVFVTTSIMERGITISRANVIVLFADFTKIYSWRTLLQMAGRAGRKAEYPEGKVWFIAGGVSSQMQEALHVIKNMNKEAKEKGYLKIGDGGK